MKTQLRSYLSKIKFALGKNPQIKKTHDPSRFIPKKYQAVVLISADFELAWAFRFSKKYPDPKAAAIEKAMTSRKNIPKILDLCNTFKIPITWATVGHLFLNGCNAEKGINHPEIPRLPYFENEYWKFNQGDWFDADPAVADYKDAPAWYAPDLIGQILAANAGHEIGCHTFSHINCRQDVCEKSVFRAEINACLEAAKPYGIQLKSFIHPGHTIGHLNILKEMGIESFRTDEANTLGYPIRHASGLWKLQNTMEFNLRPEWSVNYHLHRYQEIIRRAIKHRCVAVLWFHPSFDPIFTDRIFPEFFRFLDQQKDKLWITTHKDYTAWLNR
jgi:hypothetical protein